LLRSPCLHEQPFELDFFSARPLKLTPTPALGFLPNLRSAFPLGT
jgi:hypothetical protein